MNVCVIGAGYVGLTTAAVLSEIGHDICCVDKDRQKIEELQHGRVPLHESGLAELIEKHTKTGRLRFSNETNDAIEHNEVVLIAVGTPPAVDGSPDLTAIDEVTKAIARSIQSYKLILTKSTVPPGTNSRIDQTLRESVDDNLFDVVSNPEFLREGTAIEDSLHPNKIVVGTKNRKIVDTIRSLYHGIDAPYIITTYEGAELIKYASNAFLATKISFANELAHICDVYGASISDVTTGLGTDPRIGPDFLGAGLGYGGSCLPKDLNALEHTALRKGVMPILLYAVKNINDSQINVYIHKLEQALSELKGKQITVWGLAFKSETDDTRFSPSVKLIEKLIEKGCVVHTYDPLAREEKISESVRFYEIYASVVDSDALVIATDWKMFKQTDWQKVCSLLRGDLILDARNCLDAEAVESCGLRYTGVAR